MLFESISMQYFQLIYALQDQVLRIGIFIIDSEVNLQLTIVAVSERMLIMRLCRTTQNKGG